MPDLILASASPIRLHLLQNAGLTLTAQPARIDEAALRASLTAEAATPRDIADALAEAKARKLAQRHPTALILGCDQVLAFQTQILSKPVTQTDARHQLQTLRGQTHQLHSALVLYHDARPVWRHIGTASLTMRPFTDAFLDDFLARGGEGLLGSVGCYRLEDDGVQLFSRIDGDYFTILGLPLMGLLDLLRRHGALAL